MALVFFWETEAQPSYVWGLKSSQTGNTLTVEGTVGSSIKVVQRISSSKKNGELHLSVKTALAKKILPLWSPDFKRTFPLEGIERVTIGDEHMEIWSKEKSSNGSFEWAAEPEKLEVVDVRE